MSDITTHVFRALRLITMHTDDPLNAYRIVHHYSGIDIEDMSRLNSSGVNGLANPAANKKAFWKMIEDDRVIIVDDCSLLPNNIEWAKILEGCRDYETTMVIVNPPEPIPLAFDVGFLEVPRPVVREYLAKFVHEEHLDEMMSACAGLSIRQVTDIGKIATSMYKEFTPTSAEKVRASYFQSVQGLSRLTLHDEFYEPSAELQEWIDLNKSTFHEGVHKLLRPRGLLAGGTAGTGKTSGARHIAREFGVPCYLMQSQDIYSKWVGESGKALSRVLAQAESFSPCVLVMDEVEKLFHNNSEENHGTTNRLLAQLLWWLQEHDKMIIVVMTTNNKRIIPPELYRAGRLDCEMEFGPMDDYGNICGFTTNYIEYFSKVTGVVLNDAMQLTILEELELYFDEESCQLTHAAVIQFVVNWVKREMQNEIKLTGLQTKPTSV